MSNLAAFPDLASAREQAATWIVRIDRGLSATEHAEFAQWLRGPANRGAFEDLGGIWDRMNVMSVLAEVCPRKPRSRWRRAVPVAVGAAAAALLAVVMLEVLPRGSAPATSVTAVSRRDAYATAVGEQKTVTLADGSLLTLNTNSLIEVEYTQGLRRLLLRRGEAHFEVAHDPTRPFVVAAGALAVRAVGTAFNIRLQPGTADVLVTSGTVRVSEPAHTTAPVAVSAGQLFALAPDGAHRLQSLGPTALESRLAWRRSVLIFDGETLSQALHEVSRYTPRHVYLADPALGTVRIAGYFPTGDLSVLLASLRANFGIVATETSTGLRLAAPAGIYPASHR